MERKTWKKILLLHCSKFAWPNLRDCVMANDVDRSGETCAE